VVVFGMKSNQMGSAHDDTLYYASKSGDSKRRSKLRPERCACIAGVLLKERFSVDRKSRVGARPISSAIGA
jgi:hypothetical protein